MGTRVGSITFGGLSSGLKTDEIIQKLMQAEHAPLDQLGLHRDDFSARLDIFRDLNTKTLHLRDALRALDNLNLVGTSQSADEEFLRFAATSSDESIATASVQGASTEASLSINVHQLASASRSITTTGFATTSSSVGTGSFDITIGAVTKSITVNGSNNTVAGFVKAINDSGADVTAFTLNDGSGTPLRIVIQGNSTGAAKDVTLVNNLVGGPTFAETQDAQNAKLVLDPDPLTGVGIDVQSATNTFSNLIQGLSVQVRSVNSAATDRVSIAVEPDDDATVSAISGVVDAFNAISDAVNAQFSIDAKTNRGGPLIGDSTLSSLQQRLASVFASGSGSGSITHGSQIGLALDEKGKLSLDEDKLRSQLDANLAGVRDFFSGSGSLADRLRVVATSFVDPVNGQLTTRISGTSRTISDLNNQIAAGEDRLSLVEEGLVSQFAALERLVSDFQLQGNFVSQIALQK